ncbi:MAG: YghX family hydrolase [Candidatus Korobacteraceae bacterium]
MERKTAANFDPELLKLFDLYVHGGVSRREFLDKAARFAVGGLTAAALLESLSPNYAWAEQVPKDDARIRGEYIHYESPKGQGKMKAYFVAPAKPSSKLPGVVVIHENRGLNPYIEDVARRLAVAGFLAMAPDALTPLGGYPGDDDKGREMQSKLDGAKMIEDFIAAGNQLKSRPECSGKIGAVGFCYGGGVVNTMAVRMPDLAAGVPFYGRQPDAADVPKIKAALLIHYAGNDERINAGWPAYEAALKAAGVKYSGFIYDGVNHGFHNDTTPRFDQAAATLAWDRTIEFFNKTLR